MIYAVYEDKGELTSELDCILYANSYEQAIQDATDFFLENSNRVEVDILIRWGGDYGDDFQEEVTINL